MGKESAQRERDSARKRWEGQREEERERQMEGGKEGEQASSTRKDKSCLTQEIVILTHMKESWNTCV